MTYYTWIIILLAWTVVPGALYIFARKRLGHCDHDWAPSKNYPNTLVCGKCHHEKIHE